MRNDRVSMVNFGLIVILFDRPVTRIAGARYLISAKEQCFLPSLLFNDGSGMKKYKNQEFF